MLAGMLSLLGAAAAFPAEEPALAAARAIMESSQYCFFITVDSSGRPNARMMEPLPPLSDFTVWFGTHPKTRKVGEIRRNPRVTAAYADPQGPGYVTLAGKARIVNDDNERRRHWKAGWTVYYPGGPDGPNFTLIEFKPVRIELISVSRGIVTKPGDPPVTLVLRGSEWIASK